MSYLPTSDLKNCTLVNTAWEREARTHLMSRTKVTLTRKNFRPYFKNRLRLCHKNVDISLLDIQTPSGMTSFLKNLTPHLKRHSAKISRLHIDVLLIGYESPISSQILEIFKILKNLKSLDLRVTFWGSSHKRDFTHVSQLIEQNVGTLSSVTKLRFRIPAPFSPLGPPADQHLYNILATCLPPLIKLCPNVQVLKLVNTPVFEMSPFPPKLTMLSVRRTDGNSINLSTPQFPPLKNMSKLIRLEVNLNLHSEMACPTLLTLLAPQLEHFAIRWVTNSSPGPRSTVTFIFPIFPKLKVFEIRRSQAFFQEGKWLRPNLYFKFATEDKNTGVNVAYAKQFPVLEKIIIRKENDLRKGAKGYSDNFYFENSVPFLLETFLWSTKSPCQTLKYLDIPFPPRNRFRYNRMTRAGDCGEAEEVCHCWGLMEASIFYDLVVKVFPKVENKSWRRDELRKL